VSWITELKMNSYVTIGHEHLEYYSLATIENILKHAGMKVIRAGMNDINGGSIRCYATHSGNFKFSKTVNGIEEGKIGNESNLF
jgi:hypothetical protein